MSVSNALSPVRAAERHLSGARAEPDQLRVAASARREPLRSDVERLQQVRLPGAVQAVKQHDSG